MTRMPRAGRRSLVKVPGSNLRPIAGAHRETAPPSTKRATLTLRLRARENRADLEPLLRAIVAGRRPPLRRAEFKARFGAARRDIDRIRRFARANGFRVGRVWVAERRLHLVGPVSALAQAFGVRRVVYTIGDLTFESRTGAIYLPKAIADCVLGVYGFDHRPQALRGASAMAPQAAPSKPRASYTPPRLGRLYGFPKADGRGETIGVVALGGGYLESDLRHFFRALRLPHPRFTSVSVDGARNAPLGHTKAFDGEVVGDIETIGGLVPRADIAVYFAPNTVRGFFDAVSSAVHDTRRRISVLSISWGQSEVRWTKHAIRAFNDVLLDAAVLGITVCCSSGDHGPFADPDDRVPHVCFPASSPYALACGGTTLLAKGTRITSETAWSNRKGASGGGVSEVFPLPSWQRASRVPRTRAGRRGRGVPDVASNGDPLTGFRIFGFGKWHVNAGTSAAAPVWAALVARINQLRGGPIGFLTPFLYDQYARLVKAGAIRMITRGGNQRYRAHRSWNGCTGLGVPDGTKLADAVMQSWPPVR
jgi:kumamolisin